MRVILYYQAAAAVALAAFLLTSATAWEQLGGAVYDLAWWYLASGLLTALFIYAYWKYAVAEWGRYTPQSVALVAFYPLAYVIIYASLTSISLTGEGAINLAVWTSAIVSIAMVVYAVRLGAPLTSGRPWRDILVGAREAAPLALALGVPMAWLIAAFYEADRIMRRAPAAGLAVWLSTALGIYALLGVVTADTLKLQLGVLELFLWPGIIAWEELMSRFLLPVVGPLANYMFVVLHAPSRWVYAIFFAPAILAVISLVTRSITKAFERGGLVGAITAHSVYNAGVGWLYSLLESPLSGGLLLLILIAVWLLVRRGYE